MWVRKKTARESGGTERARERDEANTPHRETGKKQQDTKDKVFWLNVRGKHTRFPHSREEVVRVRVCERESVCVRGSLLTAFGLFHECGHWCCEL